MKTPSEVLTRPEINAVLEILFHHATPEQRQAVMAHCPVAYAKLYADIPGIKLAVVQYVNEALEKKP